MITNSLRGPDFHLRASHHLERPAFNEFSNSPLKVSLLIEQVVSELGGDNIKADDDPHGNEERRGQGLEPMTPLGAQAFSQDRSAKIAFSAERSCFSDVLHRLFVYATRGGDADARIN